MLRIACQDHYLRMDLLRTFESQHFKVTFDSGSISTNGNNVQNQNTVLVYEYVHIYIHTYKYMYECVLFIQLSLIIFSIKYISLLKNQFLKYI